MEKKICFKCKIEKGVSDFYKHKKMGDGLLGKCKDCTKLDTKIRLEEKMKDPNFVENEKKRHREKYHRLGSTWNKDNSKNYEYTKRQREKYPEKVKARARVCKMKSLNGHLHHWSYNEEHFKDVIDLSIKEHNKAHRFLIYDQERKMYRRCDTNELLDTKESHLKFINWCIETKED